VEADHPHPGAAAGALESLADLRAVERVSGLGMPEDEDLVRGEA
jgi:hypothetical protein